MASANGARADCDSGGSGVGPTRGEPARAARSRAARHDPRSERRAPEPDRGNALLDRDRSRPAGGVRRRRRVRRLLRDWTG